MNVGNAVKAACAVRGLRPTVLGVAESLGIAVYAVATRWLAGADGNYSRPSGIETVCVDDSLAPRERDAVVAHGIGHAVIYRWSLAVAEPEPWCDAFAAALVVALEALPVERRQRDSCVLCLNQSRQRTTPRELATGAALDPLERPERLLHFG